MKILSIESSCDETSVAIVEDGTKVHCNVISSQIVQHAQTGGVVPEVAARKHAQMLMPVLRRAFEESGLSWDDIDAIAPTREPGLAGSVILGRTTAAALGWAKNKPILPTHHIHGHMYSTWLDLPGGAANGGAAGGDLPQFPILTLTVSGGHSEIWLMRGHGDFEMLGQSQDDAAGEAFDKVARLLGLGYPGGPIIEERAKLGNPEAVDFPRAAMSGYDFSFSGLKTAVLYYLQDARAEDSAILDNENFVNDVAASFQEAVVDALVNKLIKAVKKYAPAEVHLAGGCSANRHLRGRIEERLTQGKRPPLFRVPAKMSYCTDNAAMIAAAAYWMKNLTLR